MDRSVVLGAVHLVRALETAVVRGTVTLGIADVRLLDAAAVRALVVVGAVANFTCSATEIAVPYSCYNNKLLALTLSIREANVIMQI